jgi:hypothetical protein
LGLVTDCLLELHVPVNRWLLLEDILELQEEVLVVLAALAPVAVVKSWVGAGYALRIHDLSTDFEETCSLECLHTSSRLCGLDRLVRLELESSWLGLGASGGLRGCRCGNRS